MKIEDYEKAIISVILKYPVGNNDIAKRICFELDSDKFNPKYPHGTIYRAIQKIVFEKGVPNIPNVSRELGTDIDNVGGEEYLQSLVGYISLIGARDGSGFENWVRTVDSAGRLRHLGLVVGKYADMYSDFEKLVDSVKDVDDFINNIVSEINKGIGSVRSNYQHVSSVVEEEKKRLELERRGMIVDLIPSGWPSLEEYFIPRPGTYGVISGLSSMGKTQFALQMLLGVAMYLHANNTPGCVCINELEMNRWRLNRRLACCLTNINSDDLASGNLSESAYKKYYDALDYIGELPIYIDDNPDLTSSRLLWNAVSIHLEKGPRILGVADYLELFSDEGDSEELRVSKVVRNHRKVCWELGSCEVAVSQLNNSVMHTATKLGGKERARYSGAIAHAADWFLEIYNPIQMRLAGVDFVLPDGYSGDFAYAVVEKNKDHKVGKISFEWVPSWTRFRDPSLPMNKLYNIEYHTKKDSEDF